MDEKKFKQLNMPGACLSFPFEHLIPFDIRKETILKIKNESITLHGEDLTGPCNKRLICRFKTCLGRSLPYLSPTAAPYIQKLAITQKIVNNELFIRTTCQGCPIFTSCTKPCQQIDQWTKRDQIQEPDLNYKESMAILDKSMKSFAEGKVGDPIDLDNIEIDKEYNRQLPWDILTQKEEALIKMRLHQQRDFHYIAAFFGLFNESDSKYMYYRLLTKMSKVAKMREFLEKGQGNLTYKQYQILSRVFLDNKSLKKVAKEFKITAAAVTQIINRATETNNITWNVFVKKVGTKNPKIIYSIPEAIR